MKGIVFIVLLATAVTALQPLRSYNQIGNCRSSKDCAPFGCCVIGMMRYSIPGCQPFRKLGEICRPNSSRSINQTFYYPNGLRIKLTNAHQILCPCGADLFCSKKSGTCERIEKYQKDQQLLRK